MSKRDEIEKALRAYINIKDWDTKTGKYSWTMAGELYDAIKHIVELPEAPGESTVVEISGKVYIKGPAEKIK